MEALESVSPYVSGPASAVFILLLVLGSIWKFVTIHVIPTVEKIASSYIEQTTASQEKLFKELEEDRAIFKSVVEEFRVYHREELESLRTQVAALAARLTSPPQ